MYVNFNIFIYSHNLELIFFHLMNIIKYNFDKKTFFKVIYILNNIYVYVCYIIDIIYNK